MKINIYKKHLGVILVMALCILNAPARAGREGHGGDGVRQDGKIYLLDLIDAGVKDQPYFNEQIIPTKYYLEAVKKSFPTQKSEFHDRLAQKLTEISTYSENTAKVLASAMQLFSFRFVQASLVDIPDEDSSLDYPDEQMVQLAIRRGRVIQIAYEHWLELHMDHQVGLIIHELVYSLQNLSAREVVHHRIKTTEYVQLSRPAREITGSFFIESYSSLNSRNDWQLLVSGKNMLEVAFAMDFRVWSMTPVRRNATEVDFAGYKVWVTPLYTGSVITVNTPVSQILNQATDYAENSEEFFYGRLHFTPEFLSVRAVDDRVVVRSIARSFLATDAKLEWGTSFNTEKNATILQKAIQFKLKTK